MFVFMVVKAQVRNCELSGHDKRKKDFPNSLDIEVTGPDLWRQFLKNQNFENQNFFMVLMAQVRTCELHGDKKNKKVSPTPRLRSHRSGSMALFSEKYKFMVLWS